MALMMFQNTGTDYGGVCSITVKRLLELSTFGTLAFTRKKVSATNSYSNE